VLLSGSPAGHIALWNLEERKLAAQMRDAHCRAVSGMRALPGEALLVTSSPDNTLKMWVFDMADGGGRLLRYREGDYFLLQCCGSGFGIRCLFDPWIRDWDGSRIIFPRA
jgi:hypothetical protein